MNKAAGATVAGGTVAGGTFPAAPAALQEELWALLAATIRADSAQLRLTRPAALHEGFPDAQALDEACAALAADPSDDYADISCIEGAATLYYYSTNSMTEAYAAHLARVEDNDPARLIAETVRDNSRIYPRPTAVKSFFAEPFNLSQSTIGQALLKMGHADGFADIQSCQASNDAVYLYSTQYLTDSHAQGLAQYYEVDCWLNP